VPTHQCSPVLNSALTCASVSVHFGAAQDFVHGRSGSAAIRGLAPLAPTTATNERTHPPPPPNERETPGAFAIFFLEGHHSSWRDTMVRKTKIAPERAPLFLRRVGLGSRRSCGWSSHHPSDRLASAGPNPTAAAADNIYRQRLRVRVPVTRKD
jgi:hypothetical protein